MIRLLVNKVEVEAQSDPETPLLWVLREELGLSGTKYSCGIGECGACTVLLNGEPVQSCTITLAQAAEARVTTIEGLTGEGAEKVLAAWAAEDVPQCGFCQPAQIITATALLAENPDPDEKEIQEGMNGVLCRCGTYPSIIRAIKRAVKRAAKGEAGS